MHTLTERFTSNNAENYNVLVLIRIFQNILMIRDIIVWDLGRHLPYNFASQFGFLPLANCLRLALLYAQIMVAAA